MTAEPDAEVAKCQARWREPDNFNRLRYRYCILASGHEGKHAVSFGDFLLRFTGHGCGIPSCES